MITGRKVRSQIEGKRLDWNKKWVELRRGKDE